MHPLGATAAKSFLPGDSLREQRKDAKAKNKDWDKFIDTMKRLGVDAKSVPPANNSSSTKPK